MRRLPRNYMRATRSVHVRRVVCMCRLGARGDGFTVVVVAWSLGEGDGITAGKGGAESTGVGPQLIW
jgi:hypothetical protein